MVHNVWPYLGGLGRLVEIPFTASEAVSTQDRYVAKTTVEGRRRVQVRPASPRSWNVDMKGARSSEVAALSAFVSGGWGAGPWHWVPVQAQRGNLLTPRESLLLDRAASNNIMDSGPLKAPDGSWAPRSGLVDLASGSEWLFTGVPVMPGQSFTWALDVVGDGATAPELITIYSDADGARVGTGDRSASTTVRGLHRTSMTLTPPEGAATVDVGVRGTVKRFARPQVTWTDREVPYATGHGCRAAVIDGLSESLLCAARDTSFSEVGFTVMEVL